MYTVMHAYYPGYQKGLIRTGLWSEGDGIRLMHKPSFENDIEFNNIVRKGTEFREFIEDKKCPLWIDRLLGGIDICKGYQYDGRLISELTDLLGENFWGFQMHEWASNYHHDIERIKEAYGRYCENHKDASLSDYLRAVDSGEEELFLEAYTAKEWMSNPMPDDLTGLLNGIDTLYKRRKSEVGAQITPVDSYALSHRIEAVNGAKRIMIETGRNIPDMRIQMAYVRGIAKANRIRFGIYYECWSPGAQLTIPYGNASLHDEWYENLGETYLSEGKTIAETEKGGSSRSLQDRILHYSYLGGASILGEEYSICTTFRNAVDFSLTDYGRIKKGFVDFVRRNPDIGETCTPLAVVLPKDVPMIDLSSSDSFLGIPLDSDRMYAETVRNISVINETLHEIFGSVSGMTGNEAHVIKNGGLPDAIDIIHSGTEYDTNKYDYLIDLTSEPDFRKKHHNIVPLCDAAYILKKSLPIWVEGPVQWFVNRKNNCFLLYIANNSGIHRSPDTGETELPDSFAFAEIKGTDDLELIGGEADINRTECGSFGITLGPGKWSFFRFYNR
ncbi:MAG: hypothetical protein ACYCWE_04600 [Eubacteriales bacterium]